MSGEIWRGTVQLGREGGFGTPVAASRIMYFRDPKLTRERDARLWKFATTTRDNTRNASLGPTRVGGTLVQPVSAEILELLQAGIKGAVAAVGGGATKTWTFTPDPVLDSLTVEWHDGARPWQAAGCYVNSLKFAGNVNSEHLLTAELFGKALIQNALTAGLAHSTPPVFEGWEAALYVDDFESAPGVSQVSGTLISWDVTISNNLGRKYFADNTINLGGVAIGELGVEATLVFEAASAEALNEFDNWDAATKRLIRLEFGNNALIGAGPDTEIVSIDIPGAWTAVDLGGEEGGTRTYELKYSYVYDTVNIFGLQVIVQTARATVFADR